MLEATVKIKVQKLDPVARIAASIAGQPAPGNDLYLPIGSVLTLDGTLSGYNVPSNALRCPIGDGLLIEPAPITGYAWDLDGRPATIEDTRGAFDSPPYNTAGDFRAILQVTAADGSKSIRTTLNVHVSDAQGNTRVFHNTPETVVHYEFNEFPDVFDGTPIPTGSVVEDLSGNGLNGTVAANDSGDLIMGPGVGSLDVPLGSNREVKHATVSNYAARIAVENDGDAFEMFPEDDFSIELYVNREATSDPVKWGILAGTWKSRNLLDDAAGDPNVFGAWYGYGLIRADEGRVAGPWSWVLSPLDGPDSPPRIGCCWENHAHFDIPNGRHYVALSVSRVNQTAITYVDGRQAGLQNLQPGWSFTTPPDYEHATFTLFSGEDDPSRNAYRPAPAGTELDAVRVQRTALTASEALENWQNIKQGKGANPEFAPTLPSAPAGLVATPGNGEVALDWSDNTEAGLQGYHVYRSDGGGPLAKITAQPVTESRYRDSGLTNGTEYCYRVAAVNASGAGPLSQAACAQPSGGGKRFKRADSDANGALDLTDVIAFLGYLFLGQGPLGCADAADADDSGVLDLTDAIYSLDYQYLGGPAPLDPGPETCGEDKTPDENGVDLGCDTACP